MAINTFRKAYMGLKCLIMVYISYYNKTTGVIILFEPPKRPIVGKKGIIKPPKGLKYVILAKNTFSKVHMSLK